MFADVFRHLLLALFLVATLFATANAAEDLGSLFGSYSGTTVDRNLRPTILTPRTVQGVQQAVLQAVKDGKRIRVSGKAHSTSSLILSDSSVYLKTTSLNRIGKIESIKGQAYVTAEPGVLLGDLADHLAKKGYSLGFGFPTFRGMTVAGAIATGSSGSSRVHQAISSQRVEAIELVLADGSIKTVNRHDRVLFKALTVNLGQVGVVTKVKLKIIPMFNIRYTTSVMDLKKESLEKFIQAPAVEDALQILWFPNQEKAVIESGVVTTDVADPGAENVHLGVDTGIRESNYQTGDFLAKGRADNTGSVDAAIEAGRLKGLIAEPRYVVEKNGMDVHSHDVVGTADKMLFARGEVLNWAYILTDYSFAIPVAQIASVMATIRDFAKQKNYSFPIAGVYMRFAHTDAGQSSYLSHIEDGARYPQLYAMIEFLEYKPKGNAPIIPNDRDRLRDELLNLLFIKHQVRFHWGKNDDAILKTSMSHPLNIQMMSQFAAIAKSLDPTGVFSNSFMKDLITRAKSFRAPAERLQKRFPGPYRFDATQQVSITGKADLAFATSEVAKYGLKPISIGINEAVFVMAMLKYGAGTFGAYDEFVMMMPVQDKNGTLAFNSLQDYLVASPRFNSDSQNPTVGNYMFRLYLGGPNLRTAETGVWVGRLLFGYPKELARVTADLSSVEKVFSVARAKTGLRIEARLAPEIGVEIKTGPFKVNSFAVMTGLGYAKWAKMAIAGRGSLPMPLSSASSFEVSASVEPLKTYFEALRFRPLVWSYVPEMEFELSALN